MPKREDPQAPRVAEVELTRRYVCGAAEHVARTARDLERSGAEPDLVEALRISERELALVLRRLSGPRSRGVPRDGSRNHTA
ncbi:MAG: hypothetical protein M3296_04610 [Actinomycetota bacterium]|nr:hypothetical protein [Actinomycetota bacterium]